MIEVYDRGLMIQLYDPRLRQRISANLAVSKHVQFQLAAENGGVEITALMNIARHHSRESR